MSPPRSRAGPALGSDNSRNYGRPQRPELIVTRAGKRGGLAAGTHPAQVIKTMIAPIFATLQHPAGESRVVDDLRDPLIALQAEAAISEPPPPRPRVRNATDRRHAWVLALLIDAVEDVLQHSGREVDQRGLACSGLTNGATSAGRAGTWARRCAPPLTRGNRRTRLRMGCDRY
jgi:hypothetical protein